MLNKLIDIQLNTKFGFRIGKCYIMIYPFDWETWGYSRNGNALALDAGPLCIRRIL